MTPFDLFVGADWSGERGPRLKRLQVAACGAGDAAPSLVANPAGGPWTRPAFAGWLLDQPGRVLCGLDFSFCFPWEDRQAYFPGFADGPEDHAAFWELVEALCLADDGLFGGGLCEVEPLQHHFRLGAVTGPSYARRLRVAEALTQQRGLGAAESVFNLVGARQVGKGSLAGMRFLRLLRGHAGVAVWPFDPVEDARLVLVETFPTAFVRMAGGGPGKVRGPERLERVLTHYGAKISCHPGESPGPDAAATVVSHRVPELVEGLCTNADAMPFDKLRDTDENPPASGPGSGFRQDDREKFVLTDDMTDALITSAALRTLSTNPSLWNPPGLSDRVRRFEGWTFGIA